MALLVLFVAAAATPTQAAPVVVAKGAALHSRPDPRRGRQ